VAAPTKTVPHPGRALAALIALIVIMVLAIAGGNLFSPGKWHNDFRVGLGLDLSSGTQLSMKATTLTGGTPSTDDMNEAKSIILSRVNATGNTGAEVQTQGDDILNVSVPGKTTEQTEQLVSETAYLNFRQTLLFEPYGGTSSSSTSTSATPSASPSASASSTAKATPSASATSTASTSAKIVPEASPSASPNATSTASAKASTSPSASASASPSPSSTSTSSTTLGDASLVNKQTLALFNKVQCTPNDTTKWKQQAGYTKPQDYDNPNVQIVSCDSSGNKYALDVAKVQGQEIASAVAELSTTSNQWEVLLTLKGGAATSAWSTLTTNGYNKYYTAGGDNDETSDFWLDTISVVLDGNVVTAPETTSPIPNGEAQITGSFTQAQATQLQNVLQYGSLPLNFDILTADTVSAQLGHAQLYGGLIAAAIGLGLVVVYSFLYYRGLGLVSVFSLVIAGSLALLAVMLLTKYQNFALELSGIAGLIVAIGITADSFVVFFERLRDEVREGKALRPAVEAGWKRARRTILVSDTVSFIAAVLLYYFSIGEVKGFAYTLGLTTVIDIIVVFLFTKPMVTILARTKFYGDGNRWSGLDPARLGARTPWRSSVKRAPARRSAGSAPRRPVSRNTGEA
jgi:preprotein translocase subunit SecD